MDEVGLIGMEAYPLSATSVSKADAKKKRNATRSVLSLFCVTYRTYRLEVKGDQNGKM